MGTDDGLYISLDAGNQWHKWTNGFPTVSTKDLAIHPREHDLVIGTFGRAAWVLDDIRPLRALAENSSALQKEVALFDSPDAYLAAYQQPTGSRFGGDALYNGENRKGGAMITYYVKDVSKKEKSKTDEGDKPETKKTGVQRKDSIVFEIFDGDRLIRTLKQKAPKKKGFHRTYWRLDEKGPNRPARKLSKSKREPSGVSVKPGTYTVKVSFGDSSDTTTITVKTDPRIEVSTKAIAEVYDMGKELEGYTQVAADAVKQLVESKNLVDKMNAQMKELDEKAYKTQIKNAKEMVKEMDSIIALFIGKEDKRQGITRNPEVTVAQRLGIARYYVATRVSGLTETETRLAQFAKNDLKSALGKVNSFFETKWKAYKQEIDNLELSPFKETETFSME